jgi:hypothetical protein
MNVNDLGLVREYARRSKKAGQIWLFGTSLNPTP